VRKVDKGQKYVYNWMDCSKLHYGDIIKLTNNKEYEFISLNKDTILVKNEDILEEVSVLKFKKFVRNTNNFNHLGFEKALLRTLLRKELISFSEYQDACIYLLKNHNKEEAQNKQA
jgi:hypothetical protein